MSVNLSQFMVDGKTVNQLIREYTRMVTCDLVASVGDTNGVAKVAPGQCWSTVYGGEDAYLVSDEYKELDAGNWTFPDAIIKAEPPSVPGGSDANTQVDVAERSLGLMPLDKAAEILAKAMMSVAGKFAANLFAQAAQKIGSRLPGGYRVQALAYRASWRGKHYAEFFMQKLCDSVHKKRKRRVGIQMISTRRSKPVGWGTFSYRPCYRRYQGRPCLPRKLWLEHYYARLAKRNKSGRKGRRTGVKVPGTKYPRPRKLFKPTGKGTVGTWGDDYDSGEAFEQCKELIGNSES